MTVPNVWSLETPSDMKETFPAVFNDPTSSTGDAKITCNSFQSVSFNSHLFDSPVLGDGFSASHRYIPNEHHRIVAGVSLGSAGNLTPWSGVKPEPKTPQHVPPLSRNITINQHFGNRMPPEQYNECHNNQFLHESTTKGMSCMAQMPFCSTVNNFQNADVPLSMGHVQVKDGAGAPEAFTDPSIYGDTRLMFDWKFSSLKVSSVPVSPFVSSIDSKIMKGRFMGSNFELTDMIGMQHPPPGSGSLLQSYLQAQVHDSEQGHLCQIKQKCKGSQPSLQGPHPPYDPFVQHQFLQKDQYQQQEENIVRNQDFASSHAESFLNGPRLMNSQNLLDLVPIEPLAIHDVIKHEQPPPMFDGIASKEADHLTTIPQRPTRFQAIHNVLFLYEHVRNCQDDGKGCILLQCMNLKRNLHHILHCKDANCTKNCFKYKRLFDHYTECRKSLCSICGPVRMRLKEVSQRNISNAFTEPDTTLPAVPRPDHKESAFKRAKTMHHFEQNGTHQVSLPVMNCSLLTDRGVSQLGQEVSIPVDMKIDSPEPVEKQSVDSNFRDSGEIYDTKIEDTEVKIQEGFGVEPAELAQVVTHSEQENLVQLEFLEADISGRCDITLAAAAKVSETKMDNPKRVVSLLDTFTVEMLREHIRSLEQHISKDKANTSESQGMEHLVDQNLCSLCGMEKLIFEAPPRYCSSCYKQINPKGVYYTMRSFKSTKYGCGAKISFCGKCHGASGESIKVGGEDIRKSDLERRLNYAETDAETEWWVQCDKCKAWQHQICALFNGKRKEALQAEYICPKCYLEGLERGKREPLPQSSILGASDLPKTILSDHIEQWIFQRLKHEREERARILKRSVDEVPGAEGLIIRVVSSVDKKLEVNPNFREVFKEEMYPSHFPYKSKVILLFQKIEGADVCLFGMYVQEYGSECAFPNQRYVCISYIDSVKYFRPEIKAATGEALRTFVYHEILIGYLNYCKKCGFTSCYIWACPSLRQDYYILYCHPKTQKTPKSDKLREWYQTMIRKAMKEKVILEHTNLYDNFFVHASECKAKVTAARLPYFDSDFWPGKADILLQEDKNESQTKGTKAVIERALRAAKRDASAGNPKDILLMHQLGEIIRPIKEDFIMIHLQHTCKYCYLPIVSGKQWVCNVCKNFQLCERCYDKGKNLDMKDRHPVTSKEKHSFRLVESDGLADTDDKDKMMQSKLFDMRTGFLGFCQSEQYQFDTLRRAKHSTMMILDHLHDPTAITTASSCAICHCNMDNDQNWHCMICQDYHLCADCYHKKGASYHKHQLVSHATMADRTLQPKRQRNGKINIQMILDALLHAPKCCAPRCAYTCCLQVKKLFLHSRKCKVRAHGGCISCKKIWLLLRWHVRVCQEFDCHVPRCKDLKDYTRKMRHSRSKESSSKVVSESSISPDKRLPSFFCKSGGPIMM